MLCLAVTQINCGSDNYHFHSWECLHFLYAYLSLRLTVEVTITISKISHANHFKCKTPANQSNKWRWSENHSWECLHFFNAHLSLRLTNELKIIISKISQGNHFKCRTPANHSTKLRWSKNQSWECLHFCYAYLSLRLTEEVTITISKISQGNHLKCRTPANHSNKLRWSKTIVGSVHLFCILTCHSDLLMK